MKTISQLIITMMICLFSIQTWAQSGKLFNTDNQLSRPRHAGVPGQERIHLDSHPQRFEQLRWLPYQRNKEGYVKFFRSQQQLHQ